MRYHLIFVMAVLLVGCATASKRVATPPRGVTQMEKDFVASSYAPLLNEADIPFAIRALVIPRPHPIANPGEEFNETDYIDPTKPMVQLVFGGVLKSSAFVLYRTGGFAGPMSHLLIARVEGAEIASYCVLFVGAQYPANLQELQDLVAKGLNPHIPPHGYGCS